VFIGKIISHYRVLEQIGTGGMSEVFLAEDTILGRRVALKFLTREGDGSERNRVLAEAIAAASIDHPCVCKIFETCEWEGRQFIVMEFVDGETLAQRLRAGPLPMPQALATAIEIAEALAEAHRKGIIHCDLKPGNVMVARGGHVKLMDFGLARPVWRARIGTDEETVDADSRGPLGGTLSYMAPEQARGENLDARADVFSFGILFFEMLSGVHPFKRNTAQSTVAAIIHEEPAQIGQYLRAANLQLRQILKRALARSPEARYATAAELAADLIAFRDNRKGQGSSGILPIIAILPFKDLSPAGDQEYFCDGLAEELIVALGRNEQLRVISRSAAFRFRNADVSLAEIGQALGATAIVEGSVRKAGERLRIVVNLLDLEHGSPIWSERYDRQLDDIFEIQDEISRAIAEKLRVTFAPPPSRKLKPSGTANVSAYELYLRGRHYWNTRNEENLRLSIEQFERAIAVDPGYALAYAGLAGAWVTLSVFGASRPGDVIPLARDAAERALALEPELPEALTASACIRAIFDWDWDASEREFESVIRLSPRFGQARQWFAMNCLAPRGEFARAGEELNVARELEPASLAISTSLGILDFFERKYDSAISRFRAVLELDEGFYLARYFLGQTFTEIGKFEEAILELRRAVSLTRRSAESVSALGYAHAVAGERAESLAALRELSDRAERSYVSPVLLAQIQIGLGQSGDAITNLRSAFRLRSSDLIWLDVRPALKTVSSNDQVVEILSGIGLRASPNAAVAQSATDSR